MSLIFFFISFYWFHRLSAIPWHSDFFLASPLCPMYHLGADPCRLLLLPGSSQREAFTRKTEEREKPKCSLDPLLPWVVPLAAVASPAWLQGTPKNPTVVFVSTRCPQKSHHLSLWGFSPLQICRLSHHPHLFASQQSHHRVTNSLY